MRIRSRRHQLDLELDRTCGTRAPASSAATTPTSERDRTRGLNRTESTNAGPVPTTTPTDQHPVGIRLGPVHGAARRLERGAGRGQGGSQQERRRDGVAVPDGEHGLECGRGRAGPGEVQDRTGTGRGLLPGHYVDPVGPSTTASTSTPAAATTTSHHCTQAVAGNPASRDPTPRAPEAPEAAGDAAGVRTPPVASRALAAACRGRRMPASALWFGWFYPDGFIPLSTNTPGP